jgi:hypothetical protein
MLRNARLNQTTILSGVGNVLSAIDGLDYDSDFEWLRGKARNEPLDFVDME